MKPFTPLILAFFGATLAAPIATESVESAKSPDILYFMPVGWGKRSEKNIEMRAEVNVERRSDEEAEEQTQASSKSPDILYFMPVGWGKRSADEA